MVIQHSIELETSNVNLPIDEFSSKKIISLYLNTPIPRSSKLHQLQMTPAFIRMLDFIEKCIYIINEDNGFNVVGCYKRVIINDKSLIGNANINNTFTGNGKEKQKDEDTQVNAGEISHCVVQIIPH